jgi:methionine-rich copper-binding protein CopC
MRFTLAALLLATPAYVLIPFVAHAETTQPAKLLVASSPAKDASGKEPVESIALNFAEKVELYAVTLYGPGDAPIDVFQTDYMPETPKKTGSSFIFPLPEPVSAPGSYKISYLVATASNKSINGFIDFTIEPEFPAPILSSNPGPDEELTGPLTELRMVLNQDVDLMLFELQRFTMQGDEVVLTSIQNFMDGSTPETSMRTGREFTFPLTTPLTEAGDYSMSYVYSVTNPDGSISAFPGSINFTVQ